MKRLVVFLAFCGIVSTPRAFGQDHVAIGAYADYFRVSQTDTNFAGVGARLGFGLTHHVMLEAEMSYDFNQAFTENFSNGTILTVQRSNFRLLHGLFGPKLALGHSNLHPFVTVKGGFLKTSFDARPANLDTFFSSVENLRSKDVMAVFYPGGGIEGRLGPVGLRLDVGDEIYFNSGAHNNLRVAFGPYIRF
jgi:hypothetical protein